MTDGAGTTNYSYDDAGRLTTVTPPSPASAMSYTWDNNGDLTARGSDSFCWDFEDRMTSATVNGTSDMRCRPPPAEGAGDKRPRSPPARGYRGDGLRNLLRPAVSRPRSRDINAGPLMVLDDGSQYVYGAGLVSQIAGGARTTT